MNCEIEDPELNLDIFLSQCIVCDSFPGAVRTR